MRQADKILKRLKELKPTAEERLFFRKYGRLVCTLKRKPSTQARLIHGIILPPHERAMLRPFRWPNIEEYHYPGSRGTAKSFCICSLGPVLESEVTARRKIMSLSASKFRGGKVIMEEAQTLVQGNLDSQQAPAPFAPEMCLHGNIVKREGDRWYIPFSTHTVFQTIPTGNEESARGFRAHLLLMDEADNWPKDVVDKIFGPFLAVKSGFEAPASESGKNKIGFTGTISHAHKDWVKTLKDRESIIREKWKAHKLLESGDIEGFRQREQENERIKYSSFHFQRWDYTDLIIPTELSEHEVYYPIFNRNRKAVEVNPSEVVEYDPRDRVDYIYTYPVNKKYAEQQLDDGLTDYDSWAAEWRCQPIESSGNVYPYELIERATDTELLSTKEAKKKGWNPEEVGPYYPQLLWECDDPCVLGVDPARTSDFCGFVVIRLGELSNKPEFDPITGTGETAWNNVIWAEQRRHMTIKEIALKILELKSRYNLVVADNSERAPGIGIDARGAASGTTVRDELAAPSADVDEYGNVNPNWERPQVIYDPTDKEYTELRTDNSAWPGLRLLWTTDQLNTEWVSFSKGQFETSKLYIAKYLSSRERTNDDPRMDAGYIGVKALTNQLVSIQGIPTKYAFKYEMPGDSRRMDMKKDLFSAFLYACYAMRDHLAIKATSRTQEPVTAALAVRRKHRLFKRRGR